MKFLPVFLGTLTAVASAAPGTTPSRDTQAAAAAQAILQFQIDPDTFTSNTPINIPGSINLNKSLISATIATTEGVKNPNAVACQAFSSGKKVGEPFTLNHMTFFNNGAKVLISSITCQ